MASCSASDGQGGVGGAENAREHRFRERRRERPGVGALLTRQIFALLHRDRDAGGGLHEQVVLGEEAGEHHAVPVLVRDLAHEPVHRLRPARAQRVPELPAVEPQAVPELPLLSGE